MPLIGSMEKIKDYKKLFHLSYFILFLGLLVVISGCDSEITYSDTSENQNNEVETNVPQEDIPEVQTLGNIYFMAKNWDADSNPDGLQFDLSPRDKNDMPVETPGIITAKLWENECSNYNPEYDYCLEYTCGKNSPIDTWSIPVKEEDYSWSGATIRLEYKNYIPNDEDMIQGCAEIVFTTENGPSFTAKEEDIFLNEVF